MEISKELRSIFKRNQNMTLNRSCDTIDVTSMGSIKREYIHTHERIHGSFDVKYNKELVGELVSISQSCRNFDVPPYYDIYVTNVIYNDDCCNVEFIVGEYKETWRDWFIVD